MQEMFINIKKEKKQNLTYIIKLIMMTCIYCNYKTSRVSGNWISWRSQKSESNNHRHDHRCKTKHQTADTIQLREAHVAFAGWATRRLASFGTSPQLHLTGSGIAGTTIAETRTSHGKLHVAVRSLYNLRETIRWQFATTYSLVACGRLNRRTPIFFTFETAFCVPTFYWKSNIPFNRIVKTGKKKTRTKKK